MYPEFRFGGASQVSFCVFTFGMYIIMRKCIQILHRNRNFGRDPESLGPSLTTPLEITPVLSSLRPTLSFPVGHQNRSFTGLTRWKTVYNIFYLKVEIVIGNKKKRSRSFQELTQLKKMLLT